MALPATSPSIFNRAMRAARLEVPLYEEVEADITATNQALLVVIMVAVASGVGAAIGASFAGASTGGLIARLASGLLSALIGWAVGSNWHTARHDLKYVDALVLVGILVLVGYWIVRRRRSNAIARTDSTPSDTSS